MAGNPDKALTAASAFRRLSANGKIARYPAAGQRIPARGQADAHTAAAARSTDTAKVRKRVKDMYVDEIIALRYRCVGRGRAFTR